MLFRVVTKQKSVQKTHFRSHNANDCWSFIDSYIRDEKFVVIDQLDREVKRPKPKQILRG